MRYLSKFLILAGALLLAACTNPGRFDNANTVDLNTAGAAADPRSPAYFQQATGDRVLFEVNQSSLSPEARGILDGQAQWLISNVEYRAVIEGHADEQGTREYNLALGARRASSVQEYLISRGVPVERLKIVSFGKERPVELCSAESCYSKNRRAVTVISVEPVS